MTVTYKGKVIGSTYSGSPGGVVRLSTQKTTTSTTNGQKTESLKIYRTSDNKYLGTAEELGRTGSAPQGGIQIIRSSISEQSQNILEPRPSEVIPEMKEGQYLESRIPLSGFRYDPKINRALLAKEKNKSPLSETEKEYLGGLVASKTRVVVPVAPTTQRNPIGSTTKRVTNQESNANDRALAMALLYGDNNLKPKIDVPKDLKVSYVSPEQEQESIKEAEIKKTLNKKFFDIQTPEEIEYQRRYEEAGKQLALQGIYDPLRIEAVAKGENIGLYTLSQGLASTREKAKSQPGLAQFGLGVGLGLAQTYVGAARFGLDVLPFGFETNMEFTGKQSLEKTGKELSAISQNIPGALKGIAQEFTTNPFLFSGELVGSAYGEATMLGNIRYISSTGKVATIVRNPAETGINLGKRFAYSSYSRAMNKLYDVRQVFKEGQVVTKLKGRVGQLFVEDIHRNPVLGDIPYYDLRKTVGVATGKEVKLTRLFGEYPGQVQFEPGKSGLLTLSARKGQQAIPSYGVPYAMPSNIDDLFFASRQFAPGLAKTGAKTIDDFGDAVFSLTKPKTYGIRYAAKITEPEKVFSKIDDLIREYGIASKSRKLQIKSELVRLYGSKELSGVPLTPIENYLGVLEPQFAPQGQGFTLSGQAIRGTTVKVKEVLRPIRFYDEIGLGIAKPLRKLESAENVLGWGLRKTDFTRRLEKLWDVSGLGREYKKVTLAEVELGIPRGRPSKLLEVSERPRATAIIYDKGKILLVKESTGKYGFPGGGIEPILDPSYYAGSKIGMTGGRVVRQSARETVAKELFEELGYKPLVLKKLNVGKVKGTVYDARFFRRVGKKSQQIGLASQADVFTDTYLVKGKIKLGKGGGTHVGEIGGIKYFNLEDIVKGSDDAFTSGTRDLAKKLYGLEQKGGLKVSFSDVVESVGKRTKSKLVKTGYSLDDYSRYLAGKVYTPKDIYKVLGGGIPTYFPYKEIKAYETKYVPSVRRYEPIVLPTYKEPKYVALEYAPNYVSKYEPVYLSKSYVSSTYEPVPSRYEETKVYPETYTRTTYREPQYYGRYRTPPSIPLTPRIPRKEKEFKEEKPLSGVQQSYNAYVRRDVKKGAKWIKVTKKPLPYNAAYNIGLKVADNTIGQSVTIKPTRKKMFLQDDPFINKTKFTQRAKKSKISGEPVLVEKRGFAIDTLGEKRGVRIQDYWKAWL